MALPRGGGTSHEKYTADGREQIAMVGELRGAYASLAAQQLGDLQRVEQQQREVNQAIKQGGQETEGMGESFGAMPGLVAKGTAAVYALVAGIRAADAAMERAFSQRAVMGNLPFQLDEVRVATLGLVDDMELARIAVEANRFEVAKSEGAMAMLAEAGTKLGLSVGKDAAQSVGDLSLALARASPLILDNLGIQLKLSEAQSIYAAAHDKTVTSLTEQERAEAFLQVGRQKALEASKRVRLELNQQEEAWVAARQEWSALARQTLPELTAKSAGLWKALSGGAKIAAEILPLVSKYIDWLGIAIKPVVWSVGLLGKSLAALARITDVVGDGIGRAAESVGEFAGEVSDWVSDTAIAQWASETTASLVEMADSGLDQLTEKIKEQIPWATELASEWDVLRNTIAGTDEGAMAKAPREKLHELLTRGKDLAKQTSEFSGQNIANLERAVVQADHMVALGEAQKLSAAELEERYEAQYTAKVALLDVTGTLADLEKAMRDEEVREATAAAKRGGGRGPTDADRMQSAGEIQLEQWRGRLRLLEAEAEIRGTTEAESLRFADVSHNIAIEELSLERQVLEVTRGKNSVERDRNAARIEAIGLEMQILDTEQKAAAAQATRAKENADASNSIAELDRQIEMNEALGVNVELLWRQRDAEALILAAQEGDEQLKVALHEQEMRRISETKEAEAEREKNREAWHKRMQARAAAQQKAEAEQAKKFQQGIETTNQFLRQGQTLAGSIIDATIKDEDKRAKAHMRADGIAAGSIAVLEGVKAIAAYADLNIPQGILHTAASATAGVQSAMLMSGNLSGAPSAGAGAAAGSGSGGQQRNTSAAPTTPDSVPTSAADRGPRRLGGPGPQTQGGGFTLVIQGDVNGNLDEETAEKWSMAMRKASYSSEAAA
jgi:hypothetical protein